MMGGVFLGLGSNLRDKQYYLSEACRLLAAEKEIVIVRKSPLYQSEPWGNREQPLFYNAVIEIGTTLKPEELLIRCQKTEDRLGRVRTVHWGPRTIDIDILLFNDLVINTDRLIVPHPYLTERDFVMIPLSVIAPNAFIPGQGELSDLMQDRGLNGLQQIAKAW